MVGQREPNAQGAFRCLLCGARQGRFVLAAKGMDLEACGGCALVQRSPLPTVAEIEAMYAEDPHYGDELRRTEGAFLERERGVLERLAARGVGGPMLDVGAGAGYLLRAALERGWRAEGIELSRPNAERMTAELGVPVHTVDLAQAPLAPKSFGLVTFSHCLEHLSDPVGALARARELLTDDGRVHIAVPHWNAAKRRLVGGRIAWIYPHHLSYFTRSSLEEALRRAGLELEHADTRPMLGRDYPFLFAGLRRARLDGALAGFLGLGERPLESLLTDNLQLSVATWRLRATMALAHTLLALWPERALGRVGLGEELRATARRA
ncbi:MAG: methyltransferase domain-containing protein [Planctomycetaceae bacterium]|nr:methyltransferase domain-containing protein [Planctomycetaceae bacterium]